MLMVMRDGGVAFQAEKKMEVGTEKTGRWGSKRAKSMRDGGEWQIKPWASDSMRLASGSANKGVGGA
jgi:hypothetical protein